MNWDNEIHPECGYENARCVCPKDVDNPPADREASQRLYDSIMEAIRSK